MPGPYGRPARLIARTGIVLVALALAGCLPRPQDLGRSLAHETNKATGFGINETWYVSTVSQKPTVGRDGVDRAKAYAYCDARGQAVIDGAAGSYGDGDFGQFTRRSTWGSMARKARVAIKVRDACMQELGFKRTRNF